MIACLDMSGAREGGASFGNDTRARTAGPVRVSSSAAPRNYAFGAPSVVSPAAPDPAQHPAGKAECEIAAVFARKTEAREAGIRRMLEEAAAKGRPVERFVAAINYDAELAPRTTNRRQLLELGIEVPASDALPEGEAEISAVLWTIIYGLARLGIFLTGTSGYTDRALLAKLCGSVLVDEVADIPPSADMSEFIDLSPCLQPPDGLEGPFDHGAGDDADDIDEGVLQKPIGTAGGDPSATGAVHAGIFPEEGRDALLPRPDRS